MRIGRQTADYQICHELRKVESLSLGRELFVDGDFFVSRAFFLGGNVFVIGTFL